MTWSSCTVGDLVDAGLAEVKTGPFGTQLRASDYVDAGTPVINVRNIGFGIIRPEKLEFIAEETVQRLSSHLLQSEDIVFGRKGAVERHVYIKGTQERWFQGSDCLRLRMIDQGRALARYLSYVFLTHEHQSWMMQQCSHGATMASLNQDIIKRIPLRLPPLPTQRRIASILSTYDDLIENNTRRIAILEEMARRLFLKFFEVGLGNPLTSTKVASLPDGWTIKPLGEICEQGGGEVRTGPFGSQLHKHDYSDRGIPVVMPKDILDDRILEEKTARVPEEIAEKLSHHKLQEGDIVYARRGDIGRKALIGHHEAGWICGTGCLRITLGDPIVPPLYLNAFLGQSEIIDIMKGRAIGATMPNLNTAILSELPIVMPPRKLTGQFASISTPLDRLSRILLAQVANLRAKRDLLLPKLVSGEIDISKAEQVAEGAAA